MSTTTDSCIEINAPVSTRNAFDVCHGESHTRQDISQAQDVDEPEIVASTLKSSIVGCHDTCGEESEILIAVGTCCFRSGDLSFVC